MELTITPLLQQMLFLIGSKRTMLRRDQKQIHTVALGSSHGDYSFNPEFFEGAFNLCCRSQDIKHSYFLYQHVAEHYKDIQQVIVFYSVFSSGSMLEKSPSEKDISVALNEFFSLGLSYEDAHLVRMHREINNKFLNANFNVPGYRGFMPRHGKGFFALEYGAEKRALEHFKFNRQDIGNQYFLKILEMAHVLGHRVRIVTPPARFDYRAHMPLKTDQLFNGLHSIVDKFTDILDIEIVHLYDDPTFNVTDFGDFDHLKPLGPGAEKLTRSIAKSFACAELK